MKKSLLTCFGIIIFIGFNLSIHAQPAFIKSAKKSGVFSQIETLEGTWFFSMYPREIIKVTFNPLASERNEQVSDAVVAKATQKPSQLKKGKNKAVVSWGSAAMVEVNSGGVLLNPLKGITVSLLKTFYSDAKRGFTFLLKPGEMIFGTGERSIPLNRRGYKLPLNNAPAYGYSLNAESLNYSVPFILSSERYAILFDNPSIGFLDIGKSDAEILEYSVTSGELSFYIIPGNNYRDILEKYQVLVGTQPLPPRWAMGNFMSRFGYRDERQTNEIIHQMKKDSVPFDAVIFDLFWFGDSIKNTIGNLEWINKNAWPDPKKMISGFEKINLKTILITEPFVLKTSLNYEQSKKYHATDSSGNPYVLNEFYFGKGGIIDIFRKDAERWFYKKYKAQTDIGVAGWWGDLGEPENHPPNVFHSLIDFGFQRKFAAGEIHNIYGHYWSKMLFENFKKDYPQQRLFHLNRSGYAGTPRFSSFPWSGDVSRSWEGLKGQLPLMQGMSISGIPYIHSDAGGFAGGKGDPELYIRWLQFAAFTPIYRPHGTALGDLDPNSMDIPSEASLWAEPTKTLAREAANTRYKWMPYNYNLSYLQTVKGKPLMTPMFFLNSNDSNLYKATDQYMWGDEVMVVPVTDSGQRIKTFYLPDGEWTNMSSMEVFPGNRWVTDSSISMQSIPVFARAGSFIPMMPGMQNTADYNSKILHVIYIPTTDGSEYVLYEDDGHSADAIRNKWYELTVFKSSGIKTLTTISIQSNGGKYAGQVPLRKMILDIPNLPKKPAELTVDGKQINVEEIWNAQTKALKIPLIFQHTKSSVHIHFD